MTSAAILTKYDEIPSKSGDLLRFEACKMLTTYAGNVGLRNMEFVDHLLKNLKKSCSCWLAYVCASLLPTLAK